MTRIDQIIADALAGSPETHVAILAREVARLRDGLTKIDVYIAGKRIVQPTHQEFIDRNFVLDELRGMARDIRANQGEFSHV